ncbi:MAG TPA: Gfo/Idh/MocA family oxidoreductase [Cyclobacteriaceae bacterium]|nr:Gfo/Idh/MocA family oxidoreductase [Cyclobacteriaceae bacterium]
MLKIGIIGLGDIARKAYLPVICQRDLEPHLFTRNEEKLRETGRQYGINNLHTSLDSLIESGIQGAFVHSATSSHFAIVEKLLLNDIHVYVDKPLTSDYTSSELLINLALERKLRLQVGFNRRFAPAYEKSKGLSNINMIIMQKNRKDLPGEVRTFVFDDFIHVIDTLLYLFPYKVETINVTGRKVDGLLHHLIIQLINGQGAIAVGIMNRDNGAVEERLEVFSPTEKHVVVNVVEEFIYREHGETRIRQSDWQSTLYKRGFVQIVDNFLREICSASTHTDASAILQTHKICEEVVNRLSEGVN